MKRSGLWVLILGLAGVWTCAAAHAPARMLPRSALHGMKVTLVEGSAAREKGSDDALVARHLESMGFRVKQVPDTAPVSVAAGSNLVVISSTADVSVLGDKYSHLGVPVFTWNTWDYPHLGLTGPVLHNDFEIIDPVQHYAQSFAILYAYGANLTSSISRAVGLKPQLFGTLYLEPGSAGWGRPGPGGTVIADYDGTPHKAAIFTYERDSTLANGKPAPARRVAFYLRSDNFHLLTSTSGPPSHDTHMRQWAIGLKLFDASIRWAVSPPARPTGVTPGSIEAALRRQAAAHKTIVFVERVHGGEGRPSDEHMVAHLRSLGFNVRVTDQTEPQSVAHGAGLVMISSTCSKYKLANKYANIDVPVLSLEGLLSDALHFSGRNRYIDYGEHGEEKESDDPPESWLNIVGAWSPMAAGLADGPVRFTRHSGVLKWATPFPDAQVIATMTGEPWEAAIFGYPKGSLMADGFIAPARRALLPMDNPTYNDLTPQGKALFDAVVLWTLGGSAR
ncbi:hypothetical protein [Oleiagrimonas sp.]|jgi:hypothetical protein|uniref:hypothetical protein n=1 Tax=Oleiagrimonas sp. TaxID=2010330 RepID=UPI0026200033|nr:hypothetical protein [Oleiagrimonas sp.]MDA3912881.1 hypothetical protein [Oleiagrimonas sp.]